MIVVVKRTDLGGVQYLNVSFFLSGLRQILYSNISATTNQQAQLLATLLKKSFDYTDCQKTPLSYADALIDPEKCN